MNYEALGFKCGLEIHQQLDTKKLFCDCPSIVRDTDHDIHCKRYLRPVTGEKGEVDIAALYEQSKGRHMEYEAASTSSCLVELDEEPPHDLNPEALHTALQVAKMLQLKIVDQIHVMRKTVIDGSNVGGFQRTALIGTDGVIETSRGPVVVESLCLEEESAQKSEEHDAYVSFKLDRLGVPLLEIATAPTLEDPEHVKEAAEKIGMILRSTGKAKRGIGTIRQDVNVSITGGARVEIKGFQDLKSIPKVIDYEIQRQQNCLQSGETLEPHVRNARPDLTTHYLRPMPGAARMYPETDVQTLRVTRDLLESITLPELIEDKVQQLVDNYQLDKDLATKLVKADLASFFAFCTKRYELKPAFIADTLLSTPKQVKKQYDKDAQPTQESYSAVFKALADGKITKESVLAIFAADDIKQAIEEHKLMSDEELEKHLQAIIEANPDVPFKALIGKAMGELRGKAEGKKIVEKLKALS